MKTAYFIVLGALLLVAVFAFSMSVGKYGVSLSEIAWVLRSKLTGGITGLDPNIETVVWQVRLPRVIGGLLIGASLAVSGTVYQGLFRNPLVSPDILGVSTGASLGAVAGIFFSQPVVVIQALAFAGGLIAVGLVYIIGISVRRRDPVLILVLAGVAIGAMLGAILSLLKVLADPYNQLPAITFWLLGSLSAINFSDIITILPAMILGLVPLVLLRWRLNILTLDEQEAQALGVETSRVRIVAIAAATLITAAAVSVSGVIGWVGLMIPHVARIIVGPEFSRLLLASILLGACYLALMDAFARTAAMIEIPLGIVTSAIGAPFFLALLWSLRRGWT